MPENQIPFCEVLTEHGTDKGVQHQNDSCQKQNSDPRHFHEIEEIFVGTNGDNARIGSYFIAVGQQSRCNER